MFLGKPILVVANLENCAWPIHSGSETTNATQRSRVPQPTQPTAWCGFCRAFRAVLPGSGLQDRRAREALHGFGAWIRIPTLKDILSGTPRNHPLLFVFWAMMSNAGGHFSGLHIKCCWGFLGESSRREWTPLQLRCPILQLSF